MNDTCLEQKYVAHERDVADKYILTEIRINK